jgi:hypothetical protein
MVVMRFWGRDVPLARLYRVIGRHQNRIQCYLPEWCHMPLQTAFPEFAL